MLEEHLNGLALMYVHREFLALQKQWWMILPISDQEEMNLLIHLLTRNFHSLYCSRFVVYISIGMLMTCSWSVYLTLLIEVLTFNACHTAHVLCTDVGVVQRFWGHGQNFRTCALRAYKVKHPAFRWSCVHPWNLPKMTCSTRAVGAGQAGQAIALPLFGRSLGKGRQKCSCACAVEVYSSSWCNSWTGCDL